MPRDGGIDLHATNRVVVFMHEQDEVISQNRWPHDLPPILGQCAPHPAAIEGLGVASTSHWDWFVDGLREADYRVHLAHPAAMQP
jgi:transposase